MNLQNSHAISPVEETGSAYERVSSLFQSLSSEQWDPQKYHDTYRRKIPQQSEIRLILAVLEDAVNCFQDNIFAVNKKRIQLFKEAEDWFISDDASWIFSFVSICSLLQLEPGYFRQGLNRWAAKQRAAHKGKPRLVAIQDRLVA